MASRLGLASSVGLGLRLSSVGLGLRLSPVGLGLRLAPPVGLPLGLGRSAGMALSDPGRKHLVRFNRCSVAIASVMRLIRQAGCDLGETLLENHALFGFDPCGRRTAGRFGPGRRTKRRTQPGWSVGAKSAHRAGYRRGELHRQDLGDIRQRRRNFVAQVLQAAGFDVVGARDLDEKSIRTSMRDFLT